MEVQNKYQNGKIYKLVDTTNNNKVIYVGSTIQKLNDRLRNHKNKSIVCPERKIYKYIHNIGWDNVIIELVEICNCENKKKLEERERYFIDELKPDLNIQKPGRSKKQWTEDNSERLSDLSKEYYERNHNIIKQRSKDRYKEKKVELYEQQKQRRQEKIICECGSQYSRARTYEHIKTKKHINHMNNLNNN